MDFWPLRLRLARNVALGLVFVWLGARRRHSRNYGNDEQRHQTKKDAIYSR
jgi:hypothetical protein